jgi:hypothetical protein
MSLKSFVSIFTISALALIPLSVKATSPRYEAPTLAQKIRDADVVVAAQVGRLKYVNSRDTVDAAAAPWQFSDLPAPGMHPNLQLAKVQILWKRDDAFSLEKELPVWIVYDRCFEGAGVRGYYPPTGEKRVFFLRRLYKSSAGQVYQSTCSDSSLPEKELPLVIRAIRSPSHSTK